jgi:hypothetical protein
MSRQQDRDHLVAQLARELPDRGLGEVVELARTLLRAGATLQRLAEAQCNGDWPADNGERPVETCVRCEQGWVPSSMTRKRIAGVQRLAKGSIEYTCQECRLQARITKLLAGYGMVPIFNGDPRGAVFLVIPPSYAERNAGRAVHNLEGIYVS